MNLTQQQVEVSKVAFVTSFCNETRDFPRKQWVGGERPFAKAEYKMVHIDLTMGGCAGWKAISVN